MVCTEEQRRQRGQGSQQKQHEPAAGIGSRYRDGKLPIFYSIPNKTTFQNVGQMKTSLDKQRLEECMTGRVALGELFQGVLRERDQVDIQISVKGKTDRWAW